MPLARYFLAVGGVLLALLFVANAVLPELPLPERPVSEKPVIRIHSDRKWPERVVFDTSIPTVVPPRTARAEASIPLAAPAVVNVAGNARARDSFAQLMPKDASADPKKPEVKAQRKPKTARRHVAPSMMVVEQRPRFGFGLFGNNIW